MSKRMVMMMAVTVAAALGAGTARADEVGDLAKLAKCSVLGAPKTVTDAAPGRVWCPVTHFAAGSAAALPAGKVLVGLTLALEKGHDVGDALTNRVTLAALVVDADGKQVKLTEITGKDDTEKQMIAETVASVALVLKGKATSATVPPGLAGYLESLPAKYPIAKAGTAWAWTGMNPTQLRLVDKTWVAIETPTANTGIFATILVPDWTSK